MSDPEKRKATRFLTYALLRCVDEKRDEALNVGVIAMDADRHEVSVQIAPDLRRIARTLPNVPVAHVQAYLESLPEFFKGEAERLTPAMLDEMSREWGNGIRLTRARTIAGKDAASVATELFANHVTVSTQETAQMFGAGRAVQTVTSRRIVRQVVARLRRRGFREKRDFRLDAEISGATQNALRVPIWFPLLVSGRLLIDSMDIVDGDERRSIDGARLIACKADEALRVADRYDVSVVLRASGSRKLDRLVSSLIKDEASVDGRGPEVHWHSKLEEFTSAIPTRQLELIPPKSRSARRARLVAGRRRG